jgi:hypothetical protein
MAVAVDIIMNVSVNPASAAILVGSTKSSSMLMRRGVRPWSKAVFSSASIVARFSSMP